MKIIKNLLLLPSKLISYINLKIHGVSYGSECIFNGFIWLKNKGELQLGNKVKINSSKLKNVIGGDTRSSIVVNKGASIIIGNNVKISNSAIYSNSSIIVENNVMIGGSCRVWDTDFHPINPQIRLETPNDNFKSKPILIKENAFIGGGTIILKGVTIGKNSIVGAGSVVSKSIPDNEIWGGNPATFIKKVP